MGVAHFPRLRRTHPMPPTHPLQVFTVTDASEEQE